MVDRSSPAKLMVLVVDDSTGPTYVGTVNISGEQLVHDANLDNVIGALNSLTTQATFTATATQVGLQAQDQSDTYTTVSSGTQVDFGVAPMKTFAFQVTQTGTVTSWDARLQLSLDNVGWTQIAAHTNATGSGIAVWSSVLAAGAGTVTLPGRYCRSRIAGIVLGVGTNVVVRWRACP